MPRPIGGTEAQGPDAFPELAPLRSTAYPSDALRAALCGIGIRPMQHEIESLRRLVERRTGLQAARWHSPDELAKILLVITRASAMRREKPVAGRLEPDLD